VSEYKLTVEGLEKERDFYFGKLRDIEVMCQECDDNNPLIQKILDVLYATEEGFAPPDEIEGGGAGDEDEYWSTPPPLVKGLFHDLFSVKKN